MFSILTGLLIIVFILLILFVAEQLDQNYIVLKKLSGPPLWPIIGNIPSIIALNNITAFVYFRKFAKEFKKTYRLWVLGKPYLHIIRAKDVEVILSSKKHAEKNILYSFMVPFMGTGLLISNNEKWQQRRRILTPAFHFNILQQFLAIFNEESVKLVEYLKQHVNKNEITDLQTLTAQFTLNTICETAMGVKLDSIDEPDQYRRNIHKIADKLAYRALRPWIFNDKIYNFFGYQKELDKFIKPVHSFSRNIIKQRRIMFHETSKGFVKIDKENIYETKKRRYAMLDTLLAAEADGNQIDEEGIREEVDTFMFEGHDTTSSGLTFILLLLAHHTDVQENVYKEIKGIILQNNEAPLEIHHYNDWKYTDRVIKECLRLYPPVPFISRNLTEEWILNGNKLAPGTMVSLHIYDIHRDPEQFSDPEKFDPDRFLPENMAKRHPFAYVPFSAGPRNCIGQKFALLEIKTLLQHIMMNYKLEPVTKIEDIVFMVDLVLRARDPVKIKFKNR